MKLRIHICMLCVKPVDIIFQAIFTILESTSIKISSKKLRYLFIRGKVRDPTSEFEGARLT